MNTELSPNGSQCLELLRTMHLIRYTEEQLARDFAAGKTPGGEWHVQPGESFAKDQVLYEMETEKVVEEVTASAGGTMIEHLVQEDGEMMVDDDACVVDYEAAT